MKNKASLIVIIFTLLQLANCIPGDQLFEIINVKLVPLDFNSRVADEFNRETEIHFEAQTQEKRISMNNGFSFNKCYAQIDPGRSVTSELDTNTFVLTLNKIIVFENDTLPPGSNILTYPSLKTNLYYWQNSRNGTTIFGFSGDNNFYQKLKTSNSVYEMDFRCSTHNGDTLTDFQSIKWNF